MLAEKIFIVVLSITALVAGYRHARAYTGRHHLAK